VVVGEVPEGGHAWVVLFLDNTEYLLEATDKARYLSWSHIPAARLQTNYQPHYMFNRSDFWANRGTRATTRYSGPQWQLASRFERGRS
jgi:hypothetical protein